MIALHGLTRNARDFDALAPLLAATGRRVLVPDVRGRGRSQWEAQPQRYQTQTYARDVVEMCAKLGIARAAFIGTSMGGLITMELALVAPALIAAAVLNDIGPQIEPEGLARIAGYVGREPAVADWAAAVEYTRTTHAPAYPRFSDDDWAVFAHRLFRTLDPEGAAPRLDYDPAIARGFDATAPGAPPDLWGAFDALAEDRPILLVRGGRSDLLSARTAAAMRARASALRVIEVADIGHAPTLDEPHSREALIAFLAPLD